MPSGLCSTPNGRRDDVIREREELAEQMRALADLATMAKSYGCDITRPAANAREAVQWTYFGYLGAIKEANGAAMSIGRISSFLDKSGLASAKKSARHDGRLEVRPVGAEKRDRCNSLYTGQPALSVGYRTNRLRQFGPVRVVWMK